MSSLYFIIPVIILVLLVGISILIIYFYKRRITLQDIEWFKSHWNSIIKSEDPNYAILEADKLLHKAFIKNGYTGSIGDCLRKYGSKHKKSLGYAHGIRNKIAHELNYKISYDDMKKILLIYKNAIKELRIHL